MINMEQAEFDLQDIQRLQKRGIRQAEAQGAAVAPEGERDTLPGWFTKKKQRYNKIKDVLNIGSGTRCTNCGLLHFCWVDTCRGCNRAMDFNLGHRDDEVRL